ncbi:MAG TPA: indolepyruvate ferredoxin oxidoreductase subunit alpha [Leucothrix mucor]|uniref:Indolepyruvate oxidoreductase subunit IorA n=1 Tax=Leucothrix mucor TaxID=45248 RepID=A0A7V2SZY3_LEUMU|nr:indolepyruvate ferredoxin oxidoreductase subunit alpha [Leucothrix mucor]
MTNTHRAFFADGNDAIAWAAQDSGVDYISHYPGSPVNRVINSLEAEKDQHNYLINHALNEHIAALSCMGASLCGARSLVVMKHVGLNIAADPLNYSAVCKIKGGMVIVVGTDPGARTSTGEEDVHWYAPQFNLPLLEPATVQGVYKCVKQAFSISEQLQLPVLVFVAGRIAYQSSLVTRQQERLKTRNFIFKKDPENLINVGAKAVRNHRDHLLRLQTLQQQNQQLFSEHFNPESSVGIVTRGASYSICYEVIESLGLSKQVHLLNIELTYPINLSDFIQFAQHKKKIIIAEDQDGFLETMIKREAFGKVTCEIQGKEFFPAWGELSDELLRDYFANEFNVITDNKALSLEIDCPERAGSFCEGCPHRSSFYGIDKAIGDGIIGGDIGCSSLPPHRTDWLLCMNAGIGISQGIAHLLPDQPLVSTGGEGSFFHGGLISLQSAVENNINLTHIIFDNRSVAMTGHQDSPTSSDKTDLGKLLEGIGVQYIFKVNAFVSSELAETIQTAAKIQGVKAIWVQGDCALQPNAEALRRFKERRLLIHNDLCHGCTLCYEKLQCPAIIQAADKKLQIDLSRCRRCTACLDVCPNNAIEVVESNVQNL